MLKNFIITLFTISLIICGGVADAQYNQQAQCVGDNCPQSAPVFVPIVPGQAASAQRLTPQQMEAAQRQLSPEQQRAVQQELAKTGGVLTPESKEALKARPEFKGLTPEDIIKGKEILDRKDRQSEKKELGIRGSQTEKKIIGDRKKSKSLFDRARDFGKYQDIPEDLLPFGYEFFQEAAVKIATERRDIPVPLKYVVGPGDEVKILLWGRMNGQYNLVVDRDGKITIPQVGPMSVAGMTFEQMSELLIKQATQIVGTNIDISMGSVKTIPVFVLGDVVRPGSYTIGSFATITDALLMAGGPTEIGSMRNVQLKRKGKLITTFDLYELLLNGDKSKDMILQAGDVIFVPVTGSLVGVAGNVRRPAIYELKDKSDLRSLLELAGGIIPTAYTQQIQVERVLKSERHLVVDLDDRELEKSKTFALQDADLIKVFSIVDRNLNVIYLNGNLKRPGKYEYKQGMKIRDLIRDSQDLLPETYYEYALIKRLTPPALQPVLVPFNLGKAVLQNDSVDNLELKPRDNVYVFNKWLFADKPYVTVEGEIRGAPKEGETESSKELSEVQKELKTLGKFDLLEKARELENELNQTNNFSIKSLRDLQDDLKKIGRPDLAEKLMNYDRKFTKVDNVILTENMKIRDAILTVGGLSHNAYLEKGEIIRLTDKKEYFTIYFNLAKAMGNDPSENLLLQDRDRIIIHSIWEKALKQTVNIDGEVSKPGTYQFTQGMTVRDFIFKAGNILESSYLQDAEITSMLVEPDSSLKYEHRNINLKKALEGDPANNIQLKPYDTLLVKKIPNWRESKTILIAGEVRFPGRYPLKKGERLSAVLERAGGYTDKAYLRGAYFTRERVRGLQQKSIEEMTLRMERELLSKGAVAVSKAASAEELTAMQAEMAQKQKFIESLRKVKATGRMTIKLSHQRLLKGSEYDIVMEEGDTLYIPEKNDVVNVVGSVMSTGSFIYSTKFGYEDYVNMTGGYSRYADQDSIFVLKADGSARKLNDSWINWTSSNNRWEMSAFQTRVKQIEPGDVIVVPEKVEHIAWLREIKDITQILMYTAVVAGVTIKLF